MSSLPDRVPAHLPNRPIYIYTLRDPRTHQIRYIGRTVNPRQRFSVHSSPSSRRKMFHRAEWLRSLHRAGVKPQMEVVSTANEQNWAYLERFHIALYRLLGCDLVNTVDGGRGTLGFSHTPEARERIRQSGIGRRNSTETLRRVSEQMRGKVSAGALAVREQSKAKAERVFSIYCALGRQRTLRAAASRGGIKLSCAHYWSRTYNWKVRARTYDRETGGQSCLALSR